MRWMMNSFLQRVQMLGRRRQLDRDLEDELAAHLALKQMSLEREGVHPVAAAREARHALGNPAAWKESTRETWMFTWLEGVRRDVVFGVRVLTKDKVFTLVALVTLAIGIGANTAIFSLINGLMLRELPVKDPEQLVRIRVTNLPPSEKTWQNGRAVEAKERRQIPFALFEVLNQRQQGFSGMFGMAGSGSTSVEIQGLPHRALTAWVTGSYFDVLKVQPQLGRTFEQEDDIRGGPSTGWNVVISDAFWSKAFGREPRAIGAHVTVDRVPFTIIGIAPPRFYGVHPGVNEEIWIPLSAMETVYPKWHWREDRGTWMLQTMARVQHGFTIDQAHHQLAAMSRSLLEEVKSPDIGKDDSAYLAMKLDAVSARSGYSWVVDSFGKTLWILMAAVGSVLLIAATNLTNLFLARSTARQQEIAIRLSIGASGRRIRRQLLIESAILATIGAALGIVMSRWMIAALVGSVLSEEWNLENPLDWRTAGFAVAILTLVVLIAGWIPAWSASHTAIYNRTNSQRHSPGAVSFRGGLIILQMALSVALLGGAGLLLASLRATMNEATGFDASHTVFVQPDLFNAGVSADRMPRAYGNILETTRRQPGVEAAAWTLIVPLTGGLSSFTIDVPGRHFPPHERIVFSHQVTDGYFRAAGIPLLVGSDFPGSVSAHPICIVSESLAKKFFGSATGALGQRVRKAEIIGVVADSKYNHIREPAPMTMYSSYWDEKSVLGMSLAVKYSGSRERLLKTLQSLFQQEAGRIPNTTIQTIAGNLSRSITTERNLTMLLTGFAAFALLISVTGITGLLSYAVQLRRKEIGIRMALGATPSLIRRQFQKHGVVLSIVGLLLGGLLSYWLRRTIDTYLFRTEPDDPLVWIAVSTLLLACATAAASIPAWKASRIDPMQTLRLD